MRIAYSAQKVVQLKYACSTAIRQTGCCNTSVLVSSEYVMAVHAESVPKPNPGGIM
jgi:hypothetical protein